MNLDSLTPSQQNAVSYLDGPLLICAGAGSGKTFTLTQRIAWAMLPGSGKGGAPFLDSIDSALVITFTNKAAGEIKDRIRSTLAAEGMTEAAHAVDGAWISTIHGMCMRILHEHALELELDPAFELAMGATASQALNESITRVLDRVREEDNPRYRALFHAYAADRVRAMLAEAIDKASHQTDGLDAFNAGPKPADAGAIARDLVGLAADAMAVGTEKNQQAAEKAEADLSALILEGRADAEAVSAVLAGVNLRDLQGKKPPVKALNSAIKEARASLSIAATVPLLRDILALSREVEGEYRATLARRGMLDTSDLIRTTLQAFDRHPELASEYTQRFKLIMVDEFQDTSQLQIDMIERIAGPSRTHLCTVGDSQQSIYRFQGADVQVYMRHKADMLAAQPVSAHRVELGGNFRSHGDVLAFVRKVCGQPGYFPEKFLDLHAETEGKPLHGGSPRIELAVTRYGTGMGSADQAASAEAAFIARRFAEFRAAGHSPADMVVLMGASTGASVYAAALRDRGFNVVVAGGSKFFDSPQVKTALALLNVLANPYDSESLLVLLSSEALPVSSDDLLQLSTYADPQSAMPRRQNPAEGLLRYDRAPQTISSALAHATAVLKRAWSKLGRVRPAQLLRETILDSGWLQRMEASGAEGLARAADVLKFIRMVEDASADGFDVVRVAADLSAQADASAEAPGALSQSSVDAIRIMTVHASKGLQFPIVAIANCYAPSTAADAPATVTCGRTVYSALLPQNFTANPVETDDAALESSTDLGEFASQLKAVNAEREYAEKKRLFYVAVTRASAAAIVAVKHRETKKGSYPGVEQDLLTGLFPGQTGFPDASGEFDYGGSRPARYTCVPLSEEDEVVAREDEASGNPLAIPMDLYPSVIESRAALSPCNPRSDFFSYTSLAAEKPQQPDALAPSENGDEPTPQRAADADKATEFGSALHQACELLAYRHSPKLQDVTSIDLERIAARWNVHDLDRLRSAFNRWRLSDVCARAFAYRRIEPEIPFCTALHGGHLEGSIDLLCTNGDGRAYLVDYKTGGSATETPKTLHDKHLLQAQCYALAVLRAGFEAVEARFVRVEQPDPIDPAQPQIVSYSFAKDDLPLLEDAISPYS